MYTCTIAIISSGRPLPTVATLAGKGRRMRKNAVHTHTHTHTLQGIVKIRDSKFGVAMVVETTKESGSYVLGFRIDPYEKMKDIVQEIHSLYQVYHASPTFGVNFELEDQVYRRNA